MSNDIVFKDNSSLILSALDDAAYSALEEIGQRAVAYAKANAPVGTPESTQIKGYVGGSLKKSITHKVVNNEVYIGTNLKKKVKDKNGKEIEVPYPIYVEVGTGKYASDGSGRKSPWGWKDKNGKEHWTAGIEPRHYLKKSVADHIDEYRKVLEDKLKNA